MLQLRIPKPGSYYGKLHGRRRARRAHHQVPHDPALPVSTAWDLGVHDATAIWFAQITRSGEWRMIDYIEDSGAGLDHYAKVLQSSGVYVTNDTSCRTMRGSKSWVQAGPGWKLTFPRARHRTRACCDGDSIADGINAVRMVLPRCWFDAGKCAPRACSAEALSPGMERGGAGLARVPGARPGQPRRRCIRYLAMGHREATAPAAPVKPPPRELGRPGTSWMGI